MAELVPPPVNRDMKVLDRSFFRKSMRLSAASVFNSKDIQTVRAKLNEDVVSTTTIKPVRDDKYHPGGKCILLRPSVKPEQPETWSKKCSELVANKVVELHPYDLTVTYENWSMGEILNAVLPELSEDDEQNPTGFAQVGHIAHLNLRNQFLPYKHLIAQVLLDKNPQVKTVINKLRDVGAESIYRTFSYEVLAGSNDFNVTVNHANCEFKFDFSEVYWNTRLGHEHERLVDTFKKGEAVCDVMAGVGPFAMPAGKKEVWVRANDLNPAGYVAMQDAILANKVGRFVTADCMDGADFIKSSSRDLLMSPRTVTIMPKIQLPRNATAQQKERALRQAKARAVELHEPPTFDHFVMNLPASAMEFLPTFRGLYHGREDLFEPKGRRRLPLIHVYAFQAKKDTENEERDELRKKLSDHLGHDLTDDNEVVLHRARLVAPNKLYYCATFRLPPEVAFHLPERSPNVNERAHADDSTQAKSQP